MLRVSSNLLIHESSHSVAYLSPQPVLPGHSLVFPKREVLSLSDLSEEEALDIWVTIQNLGRILKGKYEAGAFTMEFKEKVNPYLHFNIIPRRQGDLERNDMIYPLLERQIDRCENEELVQDAANLKSSFS